MAEVTKNTSNDSIADEPPPYSVVILSSSPETCKENENEPENPQAEKSVKKPIPSSLMASFFSPLSSRISPEKMEIGRNCCNRSTGLLLAFASGILMTAYSAMIKFLDEMDSMQVVIIRGTMQAVILGSVAAYNKSSFIGKRERWVPLLLFLVAFTGGLRILFIFTSVSRLPLGDSTTILFSSPVFVMVFSIFLLKEKCGVFKLFAGSALVTGVVLISKPPFIFGSTGTQDYDVLGYTLVCLACLMSALGVVLTKKITKQVDKNVIMFYLGVGTVVCGFIGLFGFGAPSNPPAWEWALSLGISGLGMLQQYLFVMAVTLETPSRVTVVRQSQIILAYIVQAVFFDLTPGWMDILGAGIIVLTILTTTAENQIRGLARTYCSCFRSSEIHPEQEKGEKEKDKKNVDVEIGIPEKANAISEPGEKGSNLEDKCVKDLIKEKKMKDDSVSLKDVNMISNLDETENTVNSLKEETRKR